MHLLTFCILYDLAYSYTGRGAGGASEQMACRQFCVVSRIVCLLLAFFSQRLTISVDKKAKWIKLCSNAASA